MKVALEQIKVSRERFREATGDMEGLAQSLLTFGQLQPVIIDENFELLDGFRRFTAHQMNGSTEIEVIQRAEVSELLAKEIELEANIQREDMTWQERQLAIATLNRIRMSQDTNWTQSQTAQLVGARGQNEVSEAVTLSKAMELFPELREAKTKNQALSWLKQKASQIVRVQEVKNNPADFSAIEDKIWLGDSVELIKKIPDETFDAVITDPPFGIDYGDRKAGTEGTLNSYEDGPEAYRRLLTMAPDIYRVIKPNGWLVWFFGISWYSEVKEAFAAAGFTVDELPIIWDRSGGRTHTNRPDHYFTRGYDVAIHAFKGDPQIIQRGKPNIIRVDPVSTGDRELLVERPVGLYTELIQRLTVQGEKVADFFVGSGSCPAAAAGLKRDYFGIEQNPERRAFAITKIKAWTPDA